jgi:AraC-like DNA-binding protein
MRYFAIRNGGVGLVEYKFNTLCHESENNYIFQLVTGRRLTSVYHSHDFYELICFLRGEGTQIVNDEKILAKEKTVMILTPGNTHCFVSQSDDIVLLSLSVRREEFHLLSSVYGVSFDKQPTVFAFPRISGLYEIYRENDAVSEMDHKLLLSTLLHEYCRTNENSIRSDIPKALLCAAEEMKKSENLKKGISAFVDLTNYSQSHLARLIKKHFGMGLKQYINELRLRQAYDDFVWTNESAEVIAENLGFCSYSHFYRIFKKRFTISPSTLRNGKRK